MEYSNQSNTEISDEFFTFDEWLEGDDPTLMPPEYQQSLMYQNPVEIDDPVYQPTEIEALIVADILDERPSSNESGRERKEVKERFAFKMMSEVEILEDGYRWRKYGKKMVKNSPNPRNYYKCAIEGCSVKKRVERDREDPRYVITTYKGVHNHQGT